MVRFQQKMKGSKMDDEKVIRRVFAGLFGMMAFALVSAISGNHWAGVGVGVLVAGLVYMCAKK